MKNILKIYIFLFYEIIVIYFMGILYLLLKKYILMKITPFIIEKVDIIQFNFGLIDIFFLIISFYIIYIFFKVILWYIPHNIYIRVEYKREWFGNNSRYMAKRCETEHIFYPYYDDKQDIKKVKESQMSKDGSGHIYLVDGKTFHRIYNLFTLDKLGYPRPARHEDKRFTFSVNGMSLGEKIEIYNIFHEIATILKIKNEI